MFAVHTHLNSNLKLTQIQPRFNPHPEVGYVNQLPIWIRAFTQIGFICLSAGVLNKGLLGNMFGVATPSKPH